MASTMPARRLEDLPHELIPLILKELDSPYDLWVMIHLSDLCYDSYCVEFNNIFPHMELKALGRLDRFPRDFAICGNYDGWDLAVGAMAELKGEGTANAMIRIMGRGAHEITNNSNSPAAESKAEERTNFLNSIDSNSSFPLLGCLRHPRYSQEFLESMSQDNPIRRLWRLCIHSFIVRWARRTRRHSVRNEDVHEHSASQAHQGVLLAWSSSFQRRHTWQLSMKDPATLDFCYLQIPRLVCRMVDYEVSMEKGLCVHVRGPHGKDWCFPPVMLRTGYMGAWWSLKNSWWY